ncbi:MAG: hypothetical protein A49_27300 [Methyloceanibacter sp.]|nr:MAG: hypothetical protein A49_27300 [Methyloceanibacter sp.]
MRHASAPAPMRRPCASPRRRFAGAVDLLDTILTANPDDGPSLRLRAMCRDWIETPPPEDWDGVTRLTEK